MARHAEGIGVSEAYLLIGNGEEIILRNVSVRPTHLLWPEFLCYGHPECYQ